MIEDISSESHTQINVIFPRTNSILNPHFKDSLRIQSTSSFRLPDQIRQCRICLQNQSEPNQLVSLCKCTGSVKYLHNKCFRKWVQRLFSTKTRPEQEKFIKQGVQCQLCKQYIALQFQQNYICECRLFCQKFKNHPAAFLIFFLFFLIILACISYLSYHSVIVPLNFQNQLITGIIVITALFVLGLTQILILYYCINDYIIIKRWTLQGFYKGKVIKNEIRNMRIIPGEFYQ